MDVQEQLLARYAGMIDLPAFLIQRGFDLVHEQEGILTVKDAPTGEHLHLTKDFVHGGWTYANATDPTDRGTVADFILRRDGVTRGACLDRLAACSDGRSRSLEAQAYQAIRRSPPAALERAIAAHERHRRAIQGAAKMLERLGVSPGTLDEWRFGTVKGDADVSNLLSEPAAIWASRHRRSDKAVVLIERPLDAIAHHIAGGVQEACYLATGTKLGDERRDRLAQVLADVPSGMKVVLAYGRDEAGRRMAAEVQALAPTISMERVAPTLGARWGDQMQLERRHALSIKRPTTCLER